MDCDKFLERLTRRPKPEGLTERETRLLCEAVKDILIEESNVQPIAAPVTICGDVHG